MNVLSLCDGMSCGQIALKELDIPIENYFSYEIKPTAIHTTQLNFPDTIQLGNVNEFDISQLQNNHIDLFLCGSPCQNMSLINITQKTGVNGIKSNLIYKCVEIFKQVKPTYFLFENVKSMTNSDKEVFTNLIGINPVAINSSLVSAQKRNRLYWTNIPFLPIKDKQISLVDILERNPKSEENWSDKKKAFVERKRNNSMYVSVNGDKSIPITARGYSAWNTQFVEDENGLRDLTIKEYMRLQTIPEWYQWGGLRKSQITNLIGDGWTVDVIKHILSRLKGEN